jgi:hypothetical protein
MSKIFPDLESAKFEITRLEARVAELVSILNEIRWDATPSYATERNCKAVRKGYVMSGSIRHYEISTHLITRLKNKLEASNE